jgi:predicted phosphoribosyltransferase
VIFKDRIDAGEKLATALEKFPETKKAVVISLLRGGTILGAVISKELKIKHLPLVITKIPSPLNPELALGAYCFKTTYLAKIINSLGVDNKIIRKQVSLAQKKFNDYLKRFNIKRADSEQMKNKTIIVVDDGIATGATVKAAILYLQKLNPKKIILAVPVAPIGFTLGSIKIDKIIILYQSPVFSAVSQFYESFPPVEDNEVVKLVDLKS